MANAGDDAERSDGEERRINPSEQVGGTRRFLPAVEGMRACAAIGVVITHVAFDTGHSSGIDGRLFGRFDLAVAVFFALSGFLLWRSHAAAALGLAKTWSRTNRIAAPPGSGTMAPSSARSWCSAMYVCWDPVQAARSHEPAGVINSSCGSGENDPSDGVSGAVRELLTSPDVGVSSSGHVVP